MSVAQAPPRRRARAPRTGGLTRETRETRVRVAVQPGGNGAARASQIRVQDPMLQHMLESLARWSGLALEVEASGDLRHHLIEDVGIVLGRALRQGLDMERCERVGHAIVPMDEALVGVALDLIERPFFRGQLPDPLLTHFLQSLAHEGRFTLHVDVIHGGHEHHVCEAAFKGLGIALRKALQPRAEHLSTKGRARERRG
jgi:imidazoleglycerol-phosphate dehydratase